VIAQFTQWLNIASRRVLGGSLVQMINLQKGVLCRFSTTFPHSTDFLSTTEFSTLGREHRRRHQEEPSAGTCSEDYRVSAAQGF
jgi:hypothetical protein